MTCISRKSVSAVLALACAAAMLAGASVAQASTSAKPALSGQKGKSPAAHAAAIAPAGSGQGIVQTVARGVVVLRLLDGSTISVQVGPRTLVFVDGRRATLRDVRAGFVASAMWRAGRPAVVLRSFDLSGKRAVRVGVVDSISDSVLVVTGSGGATISIPVDARTRIVIDGVPATLDAVQAGYTVVLTAKDAKGDSPAQLLRFLRPG